MDKISKRRKEKFKGVGLIVKHPSQLDISELIYADDMDLLTNNEIYTQTNTAK